MVKGWIEDEWSVSLFVRQVEVTKKPAPQRIGFSFTLSPSGLASRPTFCLQGLCLPSSFAGHPIV